MLENIMMSFDEEWYFLLPPDQYLVNGTQVGMDHNLCLFAIRGGLDADEYIFGYTFIKNFYLIFDMDNKRMGLALK
jgi:hypothetical protein